MIHRYNSKELSMMDRGETLRISREDLAGIQKLVFLDVDGVLNTIDYKDHRGDNGDNGDRYLFIREGCSIVGIYPEFVAKLNRLVESCEGEGVRFVMSSTWREDYLDTLDYLAAQGFKGVFIGMTTLEDLAYDPALGRSLRRYRHRGEDILHWLNRHEYKGDYVIIDDDPEANTGIFVGSVIQIDSSVGLTDENVDGAIALLG